MMCYVFLRDDLRLRPDYFAHPLFPRRRESRILSRAKPHVFETEELDSRFRGNDGGGLSREWRGRGFRGNGGGEGLHRIGREYGASTFRMRPSLPGQTFSRHSRAGGNPESFSRAKPHVFETDELDSRFRGNDGGRGNDGAEID